MAAFPRVFAALGLRYIPSRPSTFGRLVLLVSPEAIVRNVTADES